MSPAEQLALRNLQRQYPDSRITVDQYGTAIIDPIDQRQIRKIKEESQTSLERTLGLGRATLLKLEVQEEEEK